MIYKNKYKEFFYLFGFLICTFFKTQTQINYLDTTFGNQGIVTTEIGSNAKINSFAISNDGSIFAIGSALINNISNLVVAKYNSDGSLNNSFGVNGLVTLQYGSSLVGNDIVIDPNNNIIVSGTTIENNQNKVFIAKLLPNGNYDLNFANAGKIIDVTGESAVANAIALDLNYNIVVLETFQLSGISGVSIVRYNSNGSLDTNFGNNGFVALTDNNGDVGTSLTIDQNSKILVGGYTYVNTGTNLLLIRINNDGTVDEDFGINGTVINEITNYPFSGIKSVTTNLTNIIVTGFAGTNSNNNFMTARYNLDGSSDNSFGSSSNGIQINNIGNNSKGNSVLLYNDNEIIAAGYSDNKIAAVKYNINGSLDETFGNLGVLLVPILNYSQVNKLVFNQQDGKPVGAGWATNGKSFFALTKFNNNNIDFINITSIDVGSVNTKIPDISGSSSLQNAQVNVYLNDTFFKTVNTNELGNWNAGNSSVLAIGDNTIRVDLIQNSQIIASDLKKINVIDNLSEDSLFAYNSEDQTSLTTTYLSLPFDNIIRSGTWTYENSNFTCNKSGTYYIEYNAIAGIKGTITGLTNAVNIGAMISINNIEYVGSESNTNIDLVADQTRNFSKGFYVDLNAGDQVKLNYIVKVTGVNFGFTAGLIVNPNYPNLQPSYTLSVTRIN